MVSHLATVLAGRQADAARPMAVTLKKDQPIRGAEAILERPDGSRVPLLP
jgi:hypothetical protein